ncbi:hypothetical protein D3C80_1150670 [compost metagenome]
MTASTALPNVAAQIPITVAIITLIKEANAPTANDRRKPFIVRVSISRPSQSVPNKCPRLGARFLFVAFKRRWSLLNQKLSIRMISKKPEDIVSHKSIFFRTLNSPPTFTPWTSVSSCILSLLSHPLRSWINDFVQHISNQIACKYKQGADQNNAYH